MIILSDEAYTRRLAQGPITFFNRELCAYADGYVDGKYISPQFMEQVRSIGSEPARFAFKDAQILFSRVDGLQQTLLTIARYPKEDSAERMRRFYAQLEAWNWYAGEALRKENGYLLSLSVTKLVLFGGRLILAHNETLYPYHKWFLRVLEQVPEKPANLMELIAALVAQPDREKIDQFFNLIGDFQPWEKTAAGWGSQFLVDSEMNWLNGKTPIDDL